MRQDILAAGGLLFVSAFILIPAWLNDEVPCNLPIKPITRDDRPFLFWWNVGLAAVAGSVSMAILIFVALRALWEALVN